VTDVTVSGILLDFPGHFYQVPLYIFTGEAILCARLRPSNIDDCAGSVEELTRILAQIRARGPETRSIIRGDSGFCRESIMAWCEGPGRHHGSSRVTLKTHNALPGNPKSNPRR
jgi:hypothetical protein